MIFLLRILADMLWQYKSINIIVNIILLIVLIGIFIKNDKKISKKTWVFMCISSIFIICTCFSFFRLINEDTFILLIKILGSFLILLYGIFYKNDIYKLIQFLSTVSIIGITFFLIISFFDFAYQYWGSVKTFYGVYYFKTDMALAIVIFLSFILADNRKKNLLKYLFCIIALYLVYLTNARIHLVSTTFVILIFISRHRLLGYNFKKILIYIPIFLLILVGTISIYNKFIGQDKLQINISISEGYDNANMQGRNVIWDALFKHYNNNQFDKQLLGETLLTDNKIVSRFTILDVDSHNTYIFLLISTGILGLITFIVLQFYILKQFFYITRKTNKLDINREDLIPVLFLTLAFFTIFLISSMTASSIKYQQLTWFFMFFSGYLFNKRILNSYKE